MPAGSVIGVDLGGTKLLAGVVDPGLHVHHRAHRRALGRDAEAVIELVVSAVSELRDAAGGEVDGVGFGIPSLVDQARGTAVSTVHLPLQGVPFRDVMAERLGVPVWVDNDANAALLAEHRAGAARGATTAVLLTLGTGIGGALLVGGEVVHGARGGAGELGHMVVVRDGRLCPCGRRGCMEAYAGRGAMEARARSLADEGRETVLFEIMAERGRPRLTSGIWKRALDRGDAVARELIDAAVRALGAGVASALNVLDVEAVVIGGGLGLKLGEPYAERIREAMLPHLFASERPPALRLAALGDLGGATGAALLASRR